MAKNILCYGGTADFRVNEIADAVSLHLNFLGTEKADVKLDDVSEIIVEEADRALMSQQPWSDQFEQLNIANARLASDLRKKFIHQKILAKTIYKVFDKVKSKIDVIGGKYYKGQEDTNFIAIASINARKNDYAEQVKLSFEEKRVHMENRIKGVFEQVAEPRLDDLSLSQAKLGADMKKEFDDAENERSRMEKRLFAKSDAGSMEQRLLDAINNKLKL